jgi:[ribosomal protein S5]-alanine N-acetyltransferase
LSVALETERIVLRRLVEAYRADMIAFYGDPDVMSIRKYGARDPEQAGQAVDLALAHWDEHGFGLFAAHEKASGAFMGECGLRYLDDGSAVEISYGLLTRFQGVGFATEAARACIEHGLETLKLGTIVAFSRATNKPSHRVLEKIGMRFVAREDRGTHGVVRYEILGER